DHGVAHTPGFLAEHNIPAGSFAALGLAAELNGRIDEVFGTKKAVSSLQNYQVYLDITGLEKQGKDIPGIKRLIIKLLNEKDFIANAFETKLISEETLPAFLKEIVSNGYNDKRSGDIQFLPKPGYFDGGTRGTTHGLWNPYDAHIPLVFMGHGIKHGKTNREIYMTDIAPTLAALLQIQMPSGSVGKVISEIIN
ncbi:MAG: alkaline phosphatase family protein, partial [Ferruginibacter sp.]